MWFAEQLNSFLNLGICKEYPIMARSKSSSVDKASRINLNPTNVNPTKDNAPSSSSNPLNVSDVKAVAEPVRSTIAPEVKTTAEPRKMEVVRTESRKSTNTVVPINLDDEIRRRAYELYLQRSSGSGSAAEDWIAAEREVRQRYHQRQSA
jgi:hypothetical protein